MPFDPAGLELRFEALQRLDQVIEFLADEDHWCKGALKTDDGRRCIVGALREVDGELLLYAPIRRAIREVTGRSHRRIQTFNDGWLASHALVLEVLERARHNLEVGLIPVADQAERLAEVENHRGPAADTGRASDLVSSLLRAALVAAAATVLVSCADTSVRSGDVTYSVPCAPALVRMGIAF
jgi:hypothetical protein